MNKTIIEFGADGVQGEFRCANIDELAALTAEGWALLAVLYHTTVEKWSNYHPNPLWAMAHQDNNGGYINGQLISDVTYCTDEGYPIEEPLFLLRKSPDTVLAEKQAKLDMVSDLLREKAADCEAHGQHIDKVESELEAAKNSADSLLHTVKRRDEREERQQAEIFEVNEKRAGLQEQLTKLKESLGSLQYARILKLDERIEPTPEEEQIRELELDGIPINGKGEQHED